MQSEHFYQLIKRRLDNPCQDFDQLFHTLHELIVEQVEREGQAYLPHIGTFHLRVVQPRRFFNPKTQQVNHSKGKRLLWFSPAKVLRRGLNLDEHNPRFKKTE
jgi:nucleoid DNA-binding protein